MEKANNEFVVRLADMVEGHIRWKDRLIIPDTLPKKDRGKIPPNCLRIYNLKEEITEQELLRLKQHEEIEDEDPLKAKIDERGPVEVQTKRIYLDDFWIILTDEKEATIKEVVEE